APLNDPISQGIADQIGRALRGELPTAALDQQFRQEDAALENYLARTLGADWHLSTAGGQQWNQLKASQDSRRQQYQMAAISTLTPIEQNRRQFNYQYPLSVLSFAAPEERARVGQAENAP